MENLDVSSKIIVGGMFLVGILLLIAIYRSSRQYVREKGEYEQLKREIEVEKMRLSMWKYQVRMMLSFLPNPDEEVSFKKKTE